jgi:hypothetical protein
MGEIKLVESVLVEVGAQAMTTPRKAAAPEPTK